MEKILVILDTDSLENYEFFKESLKNRGFEVEQLFFYDLWFSADAMKARGINNESMYFLAKYIDKMSKIKSIFFSNNCLEEKIPKLLEYIAKQYEMEILYEKDIIK